MKLYIPLILLMSFFHSSSQTIPGKDWDFRYGGYGTESVRNIIPTGDGGFLLAGISASAITGDKVSAQEGLDDYWIIKIDSVQVREWDATYGGTNDDWLQNTIPTSDGGFLLAGTSWSDVGSDEPENDASGSDYWVIKVNSAGVPEWSSYFGGTGSDQLLTVDQTNDGGYILGGSSDSPFSIEKNDTIYGSYDYWLVKIDSAGTRQWDRTFGGTSNDILEWVEQTNDGGFIAGGETSSDLSGNISTGSFGGDDYWIVKTDSNGNKIWDARFGGSLNEGLEVIRQTIDGGYILGGVSYSDVSGIKTENNWDPSYSTPDCWVVKVDPDGTHEWNRRFGGTESEGLNFIQLLSNGEYLLGGSSDSEISGDKTQMSCGGFDFWIIRFSSTGNKVWDVRFGGPESEFLYDITAAEDCGYFLAGNSDSDSACDKSQDTWANSVDYWIVKTLPEDDVEQGIYYIDMDSDGFGDASAEGETLCYPPDYTYAFNSEDCNDNNTSINPGAQEINNGIDDNCNGEILEGECVNCPGDLDNNGVVNVADLLQLISVFGNVCD